MASDTIGIALDGDIPLDAFAAATRLFQDLVQNLSKEVTPEDGLDWLLDDLRIGSAVLVTRGYADDTARVQRVVEGSADVFRALGEGTAMPFSERVARPAYELTRLVGGRVLALRLYTPEYEALIRQPPNSVEQALYQQAYGTVTGTVENLYRRTRRFTLLDHQYKRAVSCHLNIGQEEIMRDAWGRNASVEGWISREAQTGRPVMIERVRSVVVHHEDEIGDFRRARGAVPRAKNEPRAEDVIRKIRDAG